MTSTLTLSAIPVASPVVAINWSWPTFSGSRLRPDTDRTPGNAATVVATLVGNGDWPPLST